MTSPTPNINKTYSMLIERESQRSVTWSSMTGDANESTALLAGKGDNY